MNHIAITKRAQCSLLLVGLAAALTVASHYEAPESQYGSAASGCLLTLRHQTNVSGHGSYEAGPSSYLTNYVSSGRREPYHHKGGSVCIGQHDVELALQEAKASLGGYVPKEIYAANSELPKPMHVSVVAEIITQATRILANRFKLPEPSILYDLPAIDLSKSRAIDKICPTFLKPNVNCEQIRYRTLTGYCNNLQYQSWGSTRSAMVRFLAPDYYDSISLPRRAYDGSPLPSARVVSFVVHQDPAEYDKYHSMLSVVWGQFIDHDMTLAVQASDENAADAAEGAATDKVDCCKSEDAHPDCFPIEIPKGDPFYGYFKQKCMHFTRAAAGLQPGCSLGPVQAMNKISSFMDGNLVYGSSIKTSQRLRSYQGGQLRSQPVDSRSAYGSAAAAGASDQPDAYNHVEASHQPPTGSGGLAGEYLLAAASGLPDGGHSAAAAAAAAAYPRLKELLPTNRHSPDFGCERRGRAKDVYCFEAGDARANEQIQLTTMHTLFMREHNRLARELSYLNPHWNDERLFQEARQIVVAQLQHITFNEFLPLIIGKDKIYEYGLELEHPGRYYQGYDSKINAGIRVEFQAAAFRYGHSVLPSYIERYNKYHQKIESIRLSKLLKQPYDLYHPGVLDSYLLGLANQRSGRMDPTLTTEVTNHLFEKPGQFFGIDLAAINIQRGRDMGVPGYNHFREYCGLPRAKYFDDLTGAFSNKTLLRLSQLYKHVDDIDLWTAGIAEYPIQDGFVGPTFACLIARQFVNLRRGDRFWYENGPKQEASRYSAGEQYQDNLQPQFSLEQLDELRKATSARLICDNSDDIETIQASPMLVADPYTNPRVPCSSLPAIDLNKWREYSQQPAYGPQMQPGAYAAPVAEAARPAVSGQDYSSAPSLTIGEYQLDKLVAEAEAANYNNNNNNQNNNNGYAANANNGYAPSNSNNNNGYNENNNAPPQNNYEALSSQPEAMAGGYDQPEMASNAQYQATRPGSSSHHFVDHVVDAASYRPETSPYTRVA